jgi:tryptophan 2,3-dioxygenase|tara:strand:+ start:17345 stop:18259 length:915 start_codon:yes stop_codon:yes gene_type:complete
MSNLNDDIKKKYDKLGENSETYMKGLLHAKPITYWDYIDVDALLSLQKPRTDFKDEEIFVMYHQVTELFLKMMVHELKQLLEGEVVESVWLDKLERLNRYTLMLINSFDVMKYGMNYDDYNTFRATLTPASGFQSAQFRFIEIYCTKLENLINEAGKSRLKPNPTVEDYFEQIYWKDAGTNRETGEKSLTLRLFEGKYLEDLTALAKKMQGNTIQEKAAAVKNPSAEFTAKLKEFDYLYNVAWPLVHLETAQHYLDSRGDAKAKEATGGSEWKKYLHPKYQQRKFFPNLLSEEELANWGKKKGE